MSKLDRDQKIVFGIGPGEDAKPVIILGISKAAWEYARGGMTHTFDLTSVGLPIKLVVFGAETHDDARKTLDQTMAQAGVPVFDETRRDFGIKP